MLLVYFFILLIAVIVVAFKTSKIRYKHFSIHTNKGYKYIINIFIFLISLCCDTSLYVRMSFFHSLEVSVHSYYIDLLDLLFGHILIDMSCQFTLSILKLYPPIVR